MKRIFLFSLAVSVFFFQTSYSRTMFSKQAADEGPAAKAITYSAPQPASSREKPPAEVKYQMQTFPVNYISAKDLAETLKPVLLQGEGVSINEGLNTIVVRASANNLSAISKVIDKMDKPPAQIFVEAKIIELKSGSGDNSTPSSLGFSWQYSRTPGSNDFVQFNGVTGSPTAGALAQGLYAQLLTTNISSYLTALEKTVGFDSIASPSITTLNHQPAYILIGSKLGYKTLLATTTGTLQQIDYLDVGTRLEFTPHISKDGYIRMSIYPSLSDGVLVDGIPQTTTTETKNQVLVKDGQTIIIGGLSKNYSNTVDAGVPVLSKIPIFGAFFRNTQLRTEKREIMVLITPHIITPEFLADMAGKASTLENRAQQNHDNAKLIH